MSFSETKPRQPIGHKQIVFRCGPIAGQPAYDEVRCRIPWVATHSVNTIGTRHIAWLSKCECAATCRFRCGVTYQINGRATVGIAIVVRGVSCTLGGRLGRAITWPVTVSNGGAPGDLDMHTEVNGKRSYVRRLLRVEFNIHHVGFLHGRGDPRRLISVAARFARVSLEPAEFYHNLH